MHAANGGRLVNCPYCQKDIFGMTGFQEILAFNKHLRKCRKNPGNIVISDGMRTAVTPIKEQDVLDALNIRAEIGQ